ncbi:hypothetical protein TNCV_1601511 [Trichonephila clavipes]|nr:hypothetical protein TNCV_1601511 [Trichonephila clavipes]
MTKKYNDKEHIPWKDHYELLNSTKQSRISQRVIQTGRRMFLESLIKLCVPKPYSPCQRWEELYGGDRVEGLVFKDIAYDM